MINKITDGRTDLVFDLIQQGHDARTTDKNGVSLMKWCAYYGDVSAIKYLIANGALLNDLGDNYDLNGAAFHESLDPGVESSRYRLRKKLALAGDISLFDFLGSVG
jgi:ankyrin repeat protein